MNPFRLVSAYSARFLPRLHSPFTQPTQQSPPIPSQWSTYEFCDAYGAGYFFVPSTDTCLKLEAAPSVSTYGGR